jgi:hypothetical protein
MVVSARLERRAGTWVPAIWTPEAKSSDDTSGSTQSRIAPEFVMVGVKLKRTPNSRKSAVTVPGLGLDHGEGKLPARQERGRLARDGDEVRLRQAAEDPSSSSAWMNAATLELWWKR